MSEIKPEDIVSVSPPKIRLDIFTFAEINKSSRGDSCLMITVPPRQHSIDVGGERIQFLHLAPKAYRKLVEFLKIHGDNLHD